MQRYSKLKFFTITALLSLAVAIPVQAAGEVNPKDDEITLSLTEAKDRLLEQNPDLELLEINLDKMYYQLHTTKEKLEDLEEDQEDYEDTLNQLKTQLANLESAKTALIARQADPLATPLPVVDYINELIHFDTKISQVKQSITSITGSRNVSYDTEVSLEAGIDSIRNNIGSLKESKAITEEKLKYNLETIYIQILNLETEIKKKESTVFLAEMALTNEIVKQDLGLNVEIHVKNSESNYQTVQNSLDSLLNQKEQLMNQLKILLGYPVGQTINPENIPVNVITLPAYRDGLDAVLENGAEIKYQEMLYDNQKEYIDDLEDEYNGSDEEIRNEKYKLKEYEINIRETRTNTESAYYNSYNNLKLLTDNLGILENQLELAKLQNDQCHLQYDLGILSKDDLAVKEDAYLQSKLNFNQKQYEYAEALAAYNMAERGYLVK